MATYADAVAFLEGFIDYERNRGRMKYNTRTLHLRRFERFLRRLDSPHRAAPVVHLAGSKGKGSTAAILHSIAVEAGLRPGLYTSPHLESYCERIRIDRRPVSKRRFAAAVESLRRRLASDGVRLESGYRTTFELLTAVAFAMFREDGVGLAIVETGLGGRLDATNVVSPQVAVVTAIGLDHTHLLGTTPRAIAREKAGIVKPGRPIVVAAQPRGIARDVLDAVRERKQAIGAQRATPLHYAPRLVKILSRTARVDGQTIRCRMHRSQAELEINLPLPGRHQAENLQTALAVIELLRARAWSISDRAIRSGAARVDWPGRIERLPGDPPLVLDGAHCPLSAEALAETLREFAAGAASSVQRACQPVFLFSLLDDKFVDEIIAPIARGFRGCTMVVFRAPSVRGCPADVLCGPLSRQGFLVETARGPADALRKALARCGEHSLLVAFGSLYSVAPLRKAYQRLTAHC